MIRSGAESVTLDNRQLAWTRGAFTALLVSMMVYLMALDSMGDVIPALGGPTVFTSGLVAVFLLGLAGYSLGSGHTLSALGLNLANIRRSLVESLLVTALLMVGACAIKLVIPAMQGRPMFDPAGSFTDYGLSFSVEHWWLYVLAYAAVAPLQELLLRGGFQNILERLLHHDLGRSLPASRWGAIIGANLVGLVFHAHVSWEFGLLFLPPGLIWGWLYARHGTLIGVSLSHAILGVWAGFILNLHL